MTFPTFPRRSAILGFAVAAFVWSVPAAAAAPRILIAGPSGDALTQRIVREVASLGMDGVRGDDTTGCSLAGVTARAEARDVSAVLCTNGNIVLVWSVTAKRITLDDVLLPPEPDTPIAVLAMRAAEVARAKAAPDLGPSEREFPPSSNVTASRESLRPALRDLPNVVDGSLDEPPSETPADAPERGVEGAPSMAPRVPSMVVGAGFGTLVGGSIPNAIFSGNLELGVTPYVAPFLRADLPIDSSSSAALSTSTGLVAAGASLPLARASSVFIPRLAAGAGAAWLAASSSGADRSGSLRATQRLYAPAAFAGVSVSTKIAGPLRLVADVVLGATASRLVVASPSQGEIATWGQPFGAIAIRAELLLQ